MHQWLERCADVEIAGFPPQPEILGKERAGDDMFAKQYELGRQQCMPADKQAKCDDQNQPRKDAANAMRVEFEERETVVREALEDDR